MVCWVSADNTLGGVKLSAWAPCITVVARVLFNIWVVRPCPRFCSYGYHRRNLAECLSHDSRGYPEKSHSSKLRGPLVYWWWINPVREYVNLDPWTVIPPQHTALLFLNIFVYLTIIPWTRMGSESIAHEAEGRMGYWPRDHEGETNNCCSKIQLVGQKIIETKHLPLDKARLKSFFADKALQIWRALFTTKGLWHIA